MEHKFDSQKFVTTGMVLGLARDLSVKGKFNFLQNARVVTEGAIESRPCIDKFFTLSPDLPQVPHSIKTITNKITGEVLRIIGIDTEIYFGKTQTLMQEVSGFSGDPLSIIDFRPEEAIEAHAYIADKLKMCKIAVNATVSDIGINAPTKALSFSIAEPDRKIIDNIGSGDVANWNNLIGSAGVPTVEDRINSVITAILYDDGIAPSYASIITTIPPTLQTGTIVLLNGADEVMVEEIVSASSLAGAANIENISYDSGASGLCTIVLSIPDISIRRNSILRLNATEYVRVLEVTRNINGLPSVRVSTIGTFAVGNSVVGAASFRIFANNTYVATNTIFAEGLITTVSAAGVSSITNTINIDLTNANGKALKNSDFLHCSLKVSDASLLIEIQLQLDCDSVIPFNNYFFYPITPNYFTTSATQETSTLSTIQQSIQREELVNKLLRLSDQELSGQSASSYDLVSDPIDYTSEPTLVGQTGLGAEQWVELFIKLGDLKRVGTDSSRTKKDIKAIRLSINSTAAVTVGLDSIWVGGGSDLESIRGNNLIPYNYIWRVRDPRTGAISNWSPPLREAIFTSRNSISLLPVDANLDFLTSYVIDIARFGGTLKDYRIIGTIKNDGSLFNDTISDLTAASNQPAGRRLKGDQIGDEEVFDFYKPFTFLDTPKLGTCNVIGTKLTVISGNQLNISYPRGVQILIDGILNRFYTNPTDASHVELEKDMGNLTNVAFEIKTPLLTGQPLPLIFGPFGEGNSGLFIFGVGNNLAAGTLYWLDGNSPDTQSDINFLEITSPSEPILAGVMYDGYGYIYTSRRNFMIIPTFQSGALGFIARESANSRGVFSRWAICAGRDYIYYLTENADGIVRVAGNGNPQSITNDSFYNFFLHSGIDSIPIELQFGNETITVLPPDFTRIEDIRLFHCRDFVYFRFVDLSGNAACLVFDERLDNWISYDTFPDGKVNVFYAEELESTSDILIGVENGVGKYINDPTSREAALKTVIVPFCMDQGDSRILKRYDEIVFDANSGEGGFTYTVFYNNGLLAEAPFFFQVAPPHTRRKYARVIGDGTGTLARNISCKTEWRMDANTQIYEEQFYFIPRADQINDRASDLEDGGVFKDKFWQGVVIEADTFGVNKEIKFFDDSNTLKQTLIINHNGKQTISYSFDNPWISHGIIQKSDDAVEWIFYRSEYRFDIEPELGKVWETQETSHGISGFKVIERIGMVARTNAVATLKIYYDDSIEEYNLNNTSGDKEKQFFFVRARKGKLLKYRIESNENFRIYENDLEIWIRQFNMPNFYQAIKPFGDKDAVQGATI
jgi:hypothetical protein